MPISLKAVIWWLPSAIALAAPCIANGQVPGTPPIVTVLSAGAPVMVREATVTSGDARITVSRQPPASVIVTVETSAGTFLVSGDSAMIAERADSSETLPPPSPEAVRNHAFKSRAVHDEHDDATSMRFVRMSSGTASQIELMLFNGAWGTSELLGTTNPQLFAALRGIGLDSTDTARVRLVSRPANERPCATLIGQADAAVSPDSGCVRTRFEQQAALLPGSPVPSYPSSGAFAVPGALVVERKRGNVLVEFVVDTLGSAEMRTLRLVQSSAPPFAPAVRRVIGSMRFSPAEVDGHKVAQLVQLPFAFAPR
jgi:hypothetical protein